MERSPSKRPESHRPGLSPVFHRILVPIDGSAQSDYAVDLACALASEMDAQVVVLHVVRLGDALDAQLGSVAPNLRDESLRNGEALLNEITRRIPIGVDVESVLREGDPAGEIVAVGILFDVDLIVIGTHSRGRTGAAVLGSVAREVARRARCPVLMVAHPPKHRADVDDDSGSASSEPDVAMAPQMV